MSTHSDSPDSRKPLRLWPGVAAAIILVVLGYVTPAIARQYAGIGMIGAAVCALLILLWWLLFSRARWYERLGGIILIAAAAFAEKFIVHPSIAGGAMGNLAYVLSIPTLCVALVAWAATSRRFAPAARAGAAVAAVVLGLLPWMLLRTGGISASGSSDFHWRWSKTPEERLLAELHDDPAPPPTAAPATTVAPPPAAPASTAAVTPPAATTRAIENPANTPVAPPSARPAEWPGFRGPQRDGVIHGVQITTDWSSAPPVQIWRRPIGPGWSSFAVSGNLIYTQEQRGEEEAVSCYRLTTGEPVWRHRDRTRFWESNGGAGPRGTPTLSNGRVYSLGATGILNVLDAATGSLIWSRPAATDLKVKTPMWGFSSSPLVVDDVVVIALAGKLAAYNTADGSPRWSGPGKGGGYTSPHLATIDGVRQVVFMSVPGTFGVDPATGKVLWQYDWEGGAIVQPGVTTDGGVLVNTISMNGGVAMRRLAVTRASGKWRVDERWTSSGLKPYFNDFVLHKGYAYGFDNNIVSCIDLNDGARKWKGGRYGNGQMVLLADQDLLLILSEEGELALVKATPDQFTEVAKIPALEGKTWNHPVLVHGVLLVRNDHEMAAYRLGLTETRHTEGAVR